MPKLILLTTNSPDNVFCLLINEWDTCAIFQRFFIVESVNKSQEQKYLEYYLVYSLSSYRLSEFFSSFFFTLLTLLIFLNIFTVVSILCESFAQSCRGDFCQPNKFRPCLVSFRILLYLPKWCQLRISLTTSKASTYLSQSGSRLLMQSVKTKIL